MVSQNIALSEIDANSPLSTTLMAKIRSNLLWLLADCLNRDVWTGYKGTDPWTDPVASNVTLSAEDAYVNAELGPIIFLPTGAKTLTMDLRIAPSGCVATPRDDQFVKFVTYDVATGAVIDSSEVYTFVANGVVDLELDLTLTAKGEVGVAIQAYQEDGGCLLETEWFVCRWNCYISEFE